MWLIQMDDEDVAAVIDNKLYVMPPGKPVEFPEFEGNIMLARHHYCGIVRVTETRDDEGVHLHTKEAREAATALLAAKDREIVTEYIQTQLEDRVKINMPALPPAGRQAKVIARSGVKLAEYGVRPVGWIMGKGAEAAAPSTDVSERIASLEAQLAKVTELLTKTLGDKAEADLTQGPTEVSEEEKAKLDEREDPDTVTLPGVGRVSTDEPGDALEYEVQKAFTVGGTKYKKGSKVRLPLEIAEQHFDQLLLVEGQ